MKYLLSLTAILIFNFPNVHSAIGMMPPPEFMKVALSLLVAKVPSSTIIPDWMTPSNPKFSIAITSGVVIGLGLGTCISKHLLAHENVLKFAISDNNMPLAQLSLWAGAPVNTFYRGRRLLGICPAQFAPLLLSYGADPNLYDDFGSTPLHLRNDHATIELLLNHGANPNLRDAEGDTPLHLEEDPAIIELLLNHGADPMIANQAGETALDANYYNIYPAIMAEWERTGKIINGKINYLNQPYRHFIMRKVYTQIFQILKEEQQSAKSRMSLLPDELICIIARQAAVDRIGAIDSKLALEIEREAAAKREKKQKQQRRITCDEKKFLACHAKMLAHRRPSGIQ